MNRLIRPAPNPVDSNYASLATMPRSSLAAAVLLTAVLLVGCATSGRPLMPTPTLYQNPDGPALFEPSGQAQSSTDLDLLYLTDRATETAPESPLPYGQERARNIRFGRAQVRLVPPMDWETLRAQSRSAKRAPEITLELGAVRELGAFPEEPYQLRRDDKGQLLRDREELARHAASKSQLQGEIRRRLASAPKQEVLLYIHGFNETFATAAFTTAELCHFLGREQVCAFFTWPASSSGNFLTSYTTTTESADYAVEHLKKSIRMISATPGLERLQILAHSRGTALTLRAVRELALEAIAAGKEPVDLYHIENLVLLSPDIDVDIAGQQLTGLLSDPDLVTVWPEGRLPRVLRGRLTIYASPEDRALLVSRWLFRSRNRVGQVRPKDIPDKTQRYFATLDRADFIGYEGQRTDFFGHSYFTSNPMVSSDLIQLIRYGKGPGEPGRELVKTGLVTWEFPIGAATQH
jgi:esterase/lipase superfamily enzyme